jgi:hypothetical protein
MTTAKRVARRWRSGLPTWMKTAKDQAVIEVVTRGEADDAVSKIVERCRNLDDDLRFYCQTEDSFIAEVDKHFEVFSVEVEEGLGDERYPEVKTTIVVDDIYTDGFIRVLLFIMYLGAVGSSRGIDVRPRGTTGKLESLCGVDGDGSDGIERLTLDGKELDIGPGHGFGVLT